MRDYGYCSLLTMCKFEIIVQYCTVYGNWTLIFKKKKTRDYGFWSLLTMCKFEITVHYCTVYGNWTLIFKKKTLPFALLLSYVIRTSHVWCILLMQELSTNCREGVWKIYFSQHWIIQITGFMWPFQESKH
jgi:hypothetical protein